MKTVKPGIYLHSKSGKKYDVLGVARHSETLGEFVVYRALYTSKEFGKNALWIRPKNNFFETVLIDGKKVPRFKRIKK